MQLGSFGDVLPSMIEKHKRAMVDCEEAASEVIAMKETEQQAQVRDILAKQCNNE